MYDWLATLAGLADQQSIELGPPASERDLVKTERALGAILPASYRAFVSRWNGAKLGSRVLSLEQVVQRARDADDYDAEMPAGHVFVAEIPLGSDGFCLATDELRDGDGPIYRYDGEGAPPSSLAYPDFEAFVHDQVRAACSHVAIRAQFEARLKARGLRTTDLADDWSRWRRGDARAVDAWPELERPLAIDRDYQWNLARHRFSRGDHAGTLAVLAVLPLDGFDDEVKSHALYWRARCLGELRRLDECAMAFDELIALAPTDGHRLWREHYFGVAKPRGKSTSKPRGKQSKPNRRAR